MARLDVYRMADGFALDCQAEIHRQLNTRFVVPMRLEADGYPVKAGLNPIFDLNGYKLVMITEFASAVFVSELGEHIGSLDHYNPQIIQALDLLISGI
jgi:toxin CcdB